MNQDDEKDVVSIKGTTTVNEIELIDEQIKIYESNIKSLRDDKLWESFYKGKEYSLASSPLQRFQQIAASETILQAWKSIKEKVLSYEH